MSAFQKLQALRNGDADTWDDVFQELWPVVFAVAQSKLQQLFPGDVEDVVIEALEKLMEKVRDVNAAEELRPLAASIAHHRAVSLLRERFAQKRGSGQTESLEAHAEQSQDGFEPAGINDSPLDALELKELAARLGKSLAALKPPQGEVLSDFFFKDCATKRSRRSGRWRWVRWAFI